MNLLTQLFNERREELEDSLVLDSDEVIALQTQRQDFLSLIEVMKKWAEENEDYYEMLDAIDLKSFLQEAENNIKEI